MAKIRGFKGQIQLRMDIGPTFTVDLESTKSIDIDGLPQAVTAELMRCVDELIGSAIASANAESEKKSAEIRRLHDQVERLEGIIASGVQGAAAEPPKPRSSVVRRKQAE